MACRSTYATQDCESYRACYRNADIKTAALNPDGFTVERERRWFGELDAYNQARKEGIEPDGTTQAAVDRARKISDLTGKPYNGARPLDSFRKE